MSNARKFFFYGSMQDSFIRRSNWGSNYVPKTITGQLKLKGYKLSMTKYGFTAAEVGTPDDVIWGSVLELTDDNLYKNTLNMFLTAGFYYKELENFGIFLVHSDSTLLLEAKPVKGGDYSVLYDKKEMTDITAAPKRLALLEDNPDID